VVGLGGQKNSSLQMRSGSETADDEGVSFTVEMTSSNKILSKLLIIIVEE